jgi:hypothetical protein
MRLSRHFTDDKAHRQIVHPHRGLRAQVSIPQCVPLTSKRTRSGRPGARAGAAHAADLSAIGCVFASSFLSLFIFPCPCSQSQSPADRGWYERGHGRFCYLQLQERTGLLNLSSLTKLPLNTTGPRLSRLFMTRTLPRRRLTVRFLTQYYLRVSRTFLCVGIGSSMSLRDHIKPLSSCLLIAQHGHGNSIRRPCPPWHTLQRSA